MNSIQSELQEGGRDVGEGEECYKAYQLMKN